jgi:hypothetical protein
MQQIQANRMMMEDRARELEESGVIRNAVRGGLDVTTPEGLRELVKIAPRSGPPLVKSLLGIETERRTGEAQGAQTAFSRAQTEQVIAKMGADKLAQYRSGLANIAPADKETYATWYKSAAPEFAKVGLTLQPPEKWSPQTQFQMLQTADSILASSKPTVRVINDRPYQETNVNGRISFTPIQLTQEGVPTGEPTQEGVPTGRFKLERHDETARPLQTPVNSALMQTQVNPARNALSPYGAMPPANAFAAKPETEPLTFEQIEARKKEAALAQKGAEERQSLTINKQFDEGKKQEVRGEFDKVLDNVLTQYKKLGSQGALIAPETGMIGRAKAVAAGSLPAGAVTIAAPERAAPIAALSNLRQTMLSALMGATGLSSKNIDSNKEMTAYLNSLSSPDQPVETIVDTLNNLSERFGKGRKITVEDITGGKPQTPEVPAGRRGAPAAAAGAVPPIAAGIDPRAIAKLRADPSAAAAFDAHFGRPGAAAAILGQ